MKNLLHLSLLIIFLLTACKPQQPQTKTLSHEEKMSKALRSEKNGWILVHVEGTPGIIGYQHGYLLANEILDLRKAMEVRNLKMTGHDREFFRNESFRILWPRVPDEYREEMQGIADGVNAKLGEGKIDIKDVVAMNALLEIPDYYVPWLEKKEKNVPPEHCSAIAATGSWTTDGKIVMAHNNWSEYVIGERWNIILDIVPDSGNRIIMDALPGFIHSGDDFYINSAGLIVTETTISAYMGFDTTGVAEFVRIRKAVQYSSDISEWVATMINGNNGGYANDWLIGDNKTGEIARLELGLKNILFEKTSDGCFVGANFPVNENLIKQETSFDPSSKEQSANMRRLRWDELMKEYKGKINVEKAKDFMGDHFDMGRKTGKAGRFSLCGHLDEDSAGKKGFDWPSSYFPAGSVNGKATDGNLAASMQFWAIAGHPCGQPFDAMKFIKEHPENEFQKDVLRNMPGNEWMLAGEILIRKD